MGSLLLQLFWGGQERIDEWWGRLRHAYNRRASSLRNLYHHLSLRSPATTITTPTTTAVTTTTPLATTATTTTTLSSPTSLRLFPLLQSPNNTTSPTHSPTPTTTTLSTTPTLSPTSCGVRWGLARDSPKLRILLLLSSLGGRRRGSPCQQQMLRLLLIPPSCTKKDLLSGYFEM